MARATIDFGIDLGTTNSSIAMLKGIGAEVIRNNEGFEITPSVVWMDKANSMIVGRRSKERLESDRGNAFSEFKRQMGTDHESVFERNGRRMMPEDLSAEVLKSLKSDVAQRIGEDLQAAVITVPAAFELPQCAATRKAAQLAGFSMSPLLQEPVAAALACGFQSENDKAFWLVYDLGGGTFDAAVIQVRDGIIQVVNHGGDNYLGGKLIDWEIVEHLLVPEAARQCRLADFRRGNPKWAEAIAKLKYHAEEAKIRLSRDQAVEIDIDPLCRDDRGAPVSFEYVLKRGDVESMTEPIVVRSINICRRILAERRLDPGNIEKVVLVGGPTLMPYIRERLSDRKAGLGIPLDFSRDPLTVVAAGAAIFAGTQRLERAVARPARGRYAVDLNYKPIGPDTEPLVGGRVLAPEGEGVAGFAIEFVNVEARPQWRSGRIGLSADGTFVVNVWAEKGRTNTFSIELYDAKGTMREIEPDRFSYTVGAGITDPPLTHSVGVGLVNNEMELFLEKGTPLPARRRISLRTAFEVRRGQAGHIIKIPVMEGQNTRADRNNLIGTLQIAAEGIRRDVPAGSEVEVVIDMDRSQQVLVKAYVPVLDEEFEEVFDFGGYRKADFDAIGREIEIQKKRLEGAREKAREIGDAGAAEGLRRIDEERMVHEVENSFAASSHDRDAGDKCEKRLLDLKAAVDGIEDALEWPVLTSAAEKELEVERNIVNNPGFGVTGEEKATFSALDREIREALKTRDADLLRQKVRELDRLGLIIMFRQPGWWVGQLEHLEKKRSTMSDVAQADGYFSQGRRAIEVNDLESLKAAVRQLWGLLPAGDEDRDKYQSTVGR